jgi:hypothetical protein
MQIHIQVAWSSQNSVHIVTSRRRLKIPCIAVLNASLSTTATKPVKRQLGLSTRGHAKDCQ